METENLYNKLIELDLKAKDKIHKNNRVKIIRALEVMNALNQPHSEALNTKEEEYDVEWIGLPIDRAELYNRINKRVDIMLEKGLIEETEFLLSKHGRIKNLVKTIGYSEIIKYIDGNLKLDEAIEELKKNTRNYAKRQLTWFRRNKSLRY